MYLTKNIKKKNIPYMVTWIIYYAWVIVFTTWWITLPLSIIGLIISIIAIIGLINAANGRAKELPIVNKFKIIK